MLPPTLCSCELGFWPKHIGGRCVAGDHKMLALPYVCPIDHYLDPSALANSPFAHRERPFLDNNRTAPALLASRATVLAGGRAAAAAAPPAAARVVALPARPDADQVVAALGERAARLCPREVKHARLKRKFIPARLGGGQGSPSRRPGRVLRRLCRRRRAARRELAAAALQSLLSSPTKERRGAKRK